MSAYVVTPTHVDALLSIALHGVPEEDVPPHRWRAIYAELDDDRAAQVDAESASEIGADLLRENIASVAHRYQESDPSNLPGPIPIPDPDQYEFTDLGQAFSRAEALQALVGFEYQACEHPDWRISRAYRFCAVLRMRLVSGLAGGDTWEITAEKAAERLERSGVKR